MLKIKQIVLPDLLNEFNFFYAQDNDYVLLENVELDSDIYNALPEGKEQYIVYTNGKYKVINGIKKRDIKQNGQIVRSEYYGPNLIQGELCKKLSISALPGSKVMINNNIKNILQVGNSSSLNLDFGDAPIYSLRVLDTNSYERYPMIINLICGPALEEV